MLERLITFGVLGYFVFVADVSSWWSTHSLAAWYANYIFWLALIVACFLANRRTIKASNPESVDR